MAVNKFGKNNNKSKISVKVAPRAVDKLLEEDPTEALRLALGKPKTYKKQAALNTDSAVTGKKRIKGKKTNSVSRK